MAHVRTAYFTLMQTLWGVSPMDQQQSIACCVCCDSDSLTPCRGVYTCSVGAHLQRSLVIGRMSEVTRSLLPGNKAPSESCCWPVKPSHSSLAACIIHLALPLFRSLLESINLPYSPALPDTIQQPLELLQPPQNPHLTATHTITSVTSSKHQHVERRECYRRSQGQLEQPK